MQEETENPLRGYLRFLRHQGWLIALVTVVLFGTAYVIVSSKQSIYRATTKILIAEIPGATAPVFTTQELSQTMSTLAQSDLVARDVIAGSRINTTPSKFGKHLKVTFKPDSAVLEVSYDSPRKAEAVRVLREFTKVFGSLLNKRFAPPVSADGKSTGVQLPAIGAEVFDPPYLQPKPVAPKKVKTLGFALGLGLALGLMLGLVRDSLDSRIRNREEAEEAFGAPVIGTVPTSMMRHGGPLQGASRRVDQRTLDALQLLRANLEFSTPRIDGPAILVTSARAEDGKTTVAGSLAEVLARSGKRVICVDADLRSPRLHRIFGIEGPSQGLLEVVRGDIEVADALKSVQLAAWQGMNGTGVEGGAPHGGASAGDGSSSGGQLLFLSAGDPSTNGAGAALTPEDVSRLIGSLESQADYVIFDAPPLLSLADAFPLALQSDNVLVVARQGRTTKEQANAVRATLNGLGVDAVGIVLTGGAAPDPYGMA
jgi:Mrp family chromosome partitioning ATPase/capsular polysaccharide biosynthesis protein